MSSGGGLRPPAADTVRARLDRQTALDAENDRIWAEYMADWRAALATYEAAFAAAGKKRDAAWLDAAARYYQRNEGNL